MSLTSAYTTGSLIEWTRSFLIMLLRWVSAVLVLTLSREATSFELFPLGYKLYNLSLPQG
jgi:hypothetical protein